MSGLARLPSTAARPLVHRSAKADLHTLLLPPGDSLGAVLLARWRGGALAETVLGAAMDGLQVLHAASPHAAAALGLVGPVVGAHLGVGVTAARAALLLEVVGPLAAPEAKAVGLLVALTHGRGAITTTMQPRHHVQRGTVLGTAVREQVVIVQALAREGQSAVLTLQARFEVSDRAVRLHIQSCRLTCERPHEDLHCCNLNQAHLFSPGTTVSLE